MCWLCRSLNYVTPSANAVVNGATSGRSWVGTITYDFPTNASGYGSGDKNADHGFEAVTAGQKKAVLFALEQSYGNKANNGFSVEGFTNAALASASYGAKLRIAQSDETTASYQHTPDSLNGASDIWLGKQPDAVTPAAGSGAWHAMLQDVGLSLGLKYGHEAFGGFAALPTNYDSVEFSVMTRRTYIGGDVGAYSYAASSAPQTFMMADILALQHLYGADFKTNSGDTVYSWDPGSGDTFVNGQKGIDAAGKVIFATIWDGSGNDTYDLSAYHTDLQIDLAPGSTSLFSKSQQAVLGKDHLARGNIYNALQYEGDARSLIENAIGGSGKDRIFGNDADNRLIGNDGNDGLNGKGGADHLEGGNGNDKLVGLSGDDVLLGGAGRDRLAGAQGHDVLTGGAGTDMFVFAPDGGNDIVTDFHGGEDMVSLQGLGIDDFGQLLSHAGQVGNDVVITLGDESSIVLENVKLDDLSARDFGYAA